ncbi:MAG: hypothetical protein U9N62_10145, partial [Thermotogota bacterium]|nr:hypothetical protein [Thermotogota bacterium]
FLADKGLIKRIYPIQHLPEYNVLPEEIVDKFHRFSRYSDTWKNFVCLVKRSEDFWQHYDFGFCNSEAEAIDAINAAVALQLRAHTLMANISESPQFVFCSDDGLGNSNSQTVETDLTVASIILDQIPIIPDMPYEEVIDFKADPITKRLNERLKLWIAQVSTKEQDQRLVRAEIEQAIIDYREFASRQASKLRLLQIELFLKAPLELIESLIRLAPSRAIGSIVDIKRKRIDLFESELKAPGNQFAYIREIEQFAPADAPKTARR